MSTDTPPAKGANRSTLVIGALVSIALAGAAYMYWKGRSTQGAGLLEQAATEGVKPGASAPAHGAKPLHALTDEQLERMVKQASAQVEHNPKDASGWAMLAHTYDMLGKFAESSKAYAKLAALMPDNAQVLADYADALAVAHGRVLDGEPTVLVKKALAIDPKNAKALALAGTAALEKKHFDEAIGYWLRARAASQDAGLTQEIDRSIAAAKAASQGGAAPLPAASAVSSVKVPSTASVANAVVAGHLSLADDLAGKASPDATVFIFARPADGSRMPVALLRKKVRDLPLDFKLDDSMAMVPTAKLSQAGTVVIGARISTRGDVMPQPGDMQGWSAAVSVGTKGIKLEISEVIK